MVRNRRLWPAISLLVYALLTSKHCTCAESVSTPNSLNDTFATTFETQTKPWRIDVSSGQVSRIAEPTSSSQKIWDLSRFQKLSIRAMREKTGTAAVRLRWVITSRVGGLYSTASAVPVGSGGAVNVAAQVDPDESDLIPEGHVRPWDALAAAEVTRIELRAECYGGASSANEVAELTLSNALLEQLSGSSAHGPALTELRVDAPPPGFKAEATLIFRIEPAPADPFSGTGDADVRVLLPDGKQALAFYDQDFITVSDGLAQRRMPVGRPYWRAHLPSWPRAGKLAISGAGRRWEFSVASLGSPPPPASGVDELPIAERWRAPLLQKIPADDPGWGCAPRFWTLTPGGAWQPAPADAVALSGDVWRPVLFWNASWGNFGGASRPDLRIAADMDLEMERAGLSGQTQPLVLLDGEALEREGVFNWDTHPLNGILAAPGEIFSRDEGLDYCRRVMRYTLARWGLSKGVSALLLTPRLAHPSSSVFHAKLASSLAVWPLPQGVPVRTTNPLTREPNLVSMLGSFEPNDSPRATRWAADPITSAADTKVLAEGRDGRSSMSITARDPRTTALSLMNTYRVRGGLIAQEPNLSAADSILFDVWIPSDAPADLRVGVHLRDRDGIWFETLLPGMIRPGDWTTYALDVSGRNAQQLKPHNSKKLWTDYSRQRVSEIGLHVFSTHPNWSPQNRDALALSARFDNIRAVSFPHGKPAAVALTRVLPSPAGIKPVPADAKPTTLALGELWESNFRISKTFNNPFDPCECDLCAIVTAPSGKRVTVPAFFNELCERREKAKGGEEIVEPLGEEFFTVRYRAQEPGSHNVTLELREAGRYDVQEAWAADTRYTPDGEALEAHPGSHWTDTHYDRRADGRRKVATVNFVKGNVTAKLDLGKQTFIVGPEVRTAAVPFHGFIRVADDQRHFQYDDGSFYYPIGPCLRSPSDTRLPYQDPKWSRDTIEKIGKRGTYQYDDYLAKFGANGINWARIWMCSWWCALEWRSDWNGYQGFGRYNMLNAWRMDYLLRKCEENNIRVDLGLSNHGQFTLDIDTEWKNNPYNRKAGGPLTAASEFFTAASAKIAHQNKLRYVLARYAHSPSIFAWCLCSEMEFTEEYEPSVAWNRPDQPAPYIESWVAQMSNFLKANDPYRHLVTTHFSHPNRGERTLMLPEVDFATSNAYSAFDELQTNNGEFNADHALSAFWSGNGALHGFHIFGKPALVEEQGRHWMGVDEKRGVENNSRDQLDADLHAGLWGSVVEPLGGATGYWWWLHVHFDNRYDDYKALAKFMEGEDMRPGKDESPLETAFRTNIPATGVLLSGRAMKSDRRLYAWIYHPSTPLGGGDFTASNGIMHVTKMKKGTYTVEFWDTYKGEVIETTELQVADDAARVELKLPVIHRDIAVKMKPKK